MRFSYFDESAKTLESLKDWDDLTESSNFAEIKIWTELRDMIEEKLGKYNMENIDKIKNDQIKLLLHEEIRIQQSCRDVAIELIEMYKIEEPAQIEEKIRQLEQMIE